MSEVKKSLEILGEMDELLNRVYVDNNVYAQGNPQVKVALDKLGGALLDVTARLTRLNEGDWEHPLNAKACPYCLSTNLKLKMDDGSDYCLGRVQCQHCQKFFWVEEWYE